jgi:putative tryptophan/tyrosine transport system substrate-binding protein
VKRRELITLAGGAAATASLLRGPFATRAYAAMPTIGYLGNGSPKTDTDYVAAFRQGLQETGFVEGRNAAVEYLWADGQYERLPALAADLARRHMTVIAALGGSPSALAAKAATTTIPVVFIVGVDPVGRGLVTSLARPGGNLTGVTILNQELGPKRLELLRDLVPTATTIALLVNPANPVVAETSSRELQAAARTLGVQLHVLQASTEQDFDLAFATMVQLRAGALVIGPDPSFVSRSEQLAALTARHALPAICQSRAFAAAGGLMSYGGSLNDAYHLAGVYTGRVLRGEKPADLPVEQATRVELIINLKAAKTIGIAVPRALIALADEVIE